ncbi:putative leucine-rich repeat-containing protein DDB_G0290503 isoform X3 [Biomphalaria glabrata]|uniref:Leucine-rich repeat-containing protein DDB_G0290503 isoform X3 n=1 Tax=Biomphalaria glabrata TaxID=6526 RepID=A0A9W2YQK2_BIOGL|nr:putative leucine-rich repeat-containing protein DDB_G0290503 isoform X3 [Biomphalaria glabrata]
MDSPRDIQNQITVKLTEDGLNPVSSDLEKLLFLWKLYQQLKDELQISHQNEAKMKEAQAEEMKEVESYVEHIRQLSDDREALIQDLESENEALKIQICHLEQETSTTAQAEIIEMLSEQGLAEIAKSPPGEQIAYLIVERTRLLEEIEKHRSNSRTDDGKNSNIKQQLEQERAEFEQELNQQRESDKILRDQLKHEHEEEISALIEENGKLEDDLQDAEMRISQLKAELNKYTEGDELETSGQGRLFQLPGRDDIKRLEEERNELNREKEDMEKEMAEIESDRADFQKEKDSFEKEKKAFEKEKSQLLKEMTRLKDLQEEIETERDDLELDKKEVEKERQSVKAQKEELENKKQEKEHNTMTSQKSVDETDEKDGTKLRRSSSDVMLRKVIEDKTKIEGELVQLKSQMRSLQNEKDGHDDVVNSLKKELEKSLSQHQLLQMKNKSLNSELESLESQLDEMEVTIETLKQEKLTLTSKNESLYAEVKTLRDEASKSFTLQNMVEILNNNNKQLNETLESIKMKYEQTASEKDMLATQNQQLFKGEQDLTTQLETLKHELDKVTKEKEQLSNQEHELLAVTKKQEQVEKMLKADLEDLNKTKEKLVQQTEVLTKENKDLLNRLDKAKDEVEAAKLQGQEIDKQKIIIAHLKEQNQQMQSQLKAAQTELEKSRERETTLISSQHLLQKTHGDTEKRLSADLENMKVKLELTLLELSKARQYGEELDLENKDLKVSLNTALKHEEDLSNNLKEEKQHNSQLTQEMNQLKLQLTEKSKVIEKFEDEKKIRLDLEAKVEVYGQIEEQLKKVKHELNIEQNKRQELEKATERLRQTQEELVAAEEELHKEQQLHTQLKVRVKELEHLVKDLEISKKSSEELLENEREIRKSFEKHMKDLQMATSQHDTLEEIAKLREELHKERATLQEIRVSESDLQLLCNELEKERNLTAELNKQITALESANKETATSTLKAALDELDRERRARAENDSKVMELEQLLDDQKIDSENMQHNLNGKIVSLQKQVQVLEDELLTIQDKYQDLQDKYNLVSKELKINQSDVMEVDKVDSSQASCRKEPPSPDNDLEKSLEFSTTKLNETLNELNKVKTKLFQTEEELRKAEADNTNLIQDLGLLKQSVEMSSKHLDQSDSELSTLKHELIETQGTLAVTQTQMKTMETKMEVLVKERSELMRNVDTFKESQQNTLNSLPYFEQERKNLLDKIKIMEKLSEKLELDNREMAQKLTEASAKANSLEAQLEREKLTSSNKIHQDRHYTEQLEHDLDTSNKYIRQLREDLHQHQSKTFKLESDSLGLTAKYESMIVHLEENIQDLKKKPTQELNVLKGQFESISKEARDLKHRNKKLEEDVSKLTCDVSRYKSNVEKLELHLQTETQIKSEVEKRNAVIDIELSKAYSQIRNLMDKNAELESLKRSYELDITMHKSSIRDAESSILKKEATYESSTKAIVARAEAAERKARELQRELEEVTQKMLHIEGLLNKAEMDRGYVGETQDKIVNIRNQLEGEKLQRTFLDQTVAELKHQVAFLKEREVKLNLENRELHQTILDLETHFNQIQNKFSLDFESPTPEPNQHSLMDQIARLQREVKVLQYELTNVSEKRDVDIKKYEERKLRTKSKLIKAREFYSNEKSKYMDQIEHMNDDLRLTRAMLDKELEWREKMDESYKQLLREKRELITQLSEMDESVRDQGRVLTMTQARLEYLEEENANLQDLLEVMTQEKYSVDKLLKELN